MAAQAWSVSDFVTAPPADTTINGTAIWCKYATKLSVAFVVTGGSGITGNVSVNISDDIPKSEMLAPYFTPTDWSPLPTATVAVAGAGTYRINGTDIAGTYIQVVWTATAGTGGTIAASLKLQRQG